MNRIARRFQSALRLALLIEFAMMPLLASADAADERGRVSEGSLLSQIVPTSQIESPEQSLFTDYEPQLGDIVMRAGYQEYFLPYKIYFNTDLTHSGIITQLEPEVIITHCTKDGYANGVQSTPLHLWALKATRLEIYRLKDPERVDMRKIVHKTLELKDEGILFDPTYDLRKSTPKPGEKRRMYCTTMIWFAYKEEGVNLMPKPWIETNPLLLIGLYFAGVRSLTLYPIKVLKHSPELDKVTSIPVKVQSVGESITIMSNLPDRPAPAAESDTEKENRTVSESTANDDETQQQEEPDLLKQVIPEDFGRTLDDFANYPLNPQLGEY